MKYLNIIVPIVVVVIVGGILVIGFMNKDATPNNPIITPQPVPTPVPTPAPSPTPTPSPVQIPSNWLAHIDKITGFQVGYPPNFQIQTETPCEIKYSNGSKLENNRGTFIEHTFSYNSLVPPRTNYQNFTDLSLWLCTFDENYEDLANNYTAPTNPTSLFGHNAFYWEGGVEEFSGITYLIEKKSGGTIVARVYYYNEVVGPNYATDQKEYINFVEQQKIANQILSTLQFTK